MGFHFFGSDEGYTLPTWGLGQQVSLPLGPPPPVFAHHLGHQFVTLCEILKRTGRIFLSYVDFCYVSFWLIFLLKVLSVWKFVKNGVLKCIANKGNRKTHNYVLYKTAISDFQHFGIVVKNKICFEKRDDKIWNLKIFEKPGLILEGRVGTIHIPNLKKISLILAF